MTSPFKGDGNNDIFEDLYLFPDAFILIQGMFKDNKYVNLDYTIISNAPS